MERKTATKATETTVEKVKVNPLKNESVFVRFIPRENSFAGNNKNHLVYGNRAEGTTVALCVPILRSTGTFKNVLTNDEKAFLEEALGLDYNALSVYKKENNYWDNYRVSLPKEGIRLNLSNPEDYIKYKVLLANSDLIAPSMQERIDRPKQTYLYEIVRDVEETNLETAKMDATMSSYKEFGKIENDLDTMRVLAEILDARPYARTNSLNFFKSRINVLIQADPKAFLKQITDPLLHTKVVIRRATELGKLSKRGDYYYLAADGSPLCENGENPTLTVAAKFLNQTAHQDVRFVLESEVDKNR